MKSQKGSNAIISKLCKIIIAILLTFSGLTDVSYQTPQYIKSIVNQKEEDEKSPGPAYVKKEKN